MPKTLKLRHRIDTCEVRHVSLLMEAFVLPQERPAPSSLGLYVLNMTRDLLSLSHINVHFSRGVLNFHIVLIIHELFKMVYFGMTEITFPYAFVSLSSIREEDAFGVTVLLQQFSQSACIPILDRDKDAISY